MKIFLNFEIKSSFQRGLLNALIKLLLALIMKYLEDPKKDLPQFEIRSNYFEWQATVVKGNSTGAGWITLPFDERARYILGETYQIIVCLGTENILDQNLKLTNNKLSWGFYIKASICNLYKLISKDVKITIQDSKYISCKLSKDYRVRLPNAIVTKYKIENDDILLIQIKINGKNNKNYVKINKINRAGKQLRSDEYYFSFSKLKQFTGNILNIKIIKKLQKVGVANNKSNLEILGTIELFSDSIIGEIDNDEIIIFSGNREPICIKTHYEIKEFIHYFGCFYADGTKVGTGFRINASTPEQAIYYNSKLCNLIHKIILDFDLTYTKKPKDLRANHTIKLDLVNYWYKTTGITLKTKKIYIIESNSEIEGKWNKNGSLGIRAYKSFITEFHIRFLERIKRDSKLYSKEMKWQFLLGILEGDGFVSGGRERIGIGIACHSEDQIIVPLLNQIGISYVIDAFKQKSYPKGNSYSVIMSLKEILKNLEIFKEFLFIYYPKRRKKFILRLLEKSVIKSILHNELDSPYIQKYIVEEPAVDINIIKSFLLELAKERESYENK